MNDRLLRALRRQRVDATPVWFMRQAGRVLPRYREARGEREMFAILRDPHAAAEVTAMPLDYFPVDAAVLYNDLVTPFIAAGLEVEMRPGVGPVVHDPLDAPGDVGRLRPFDPRVALSYSLEQIRLLKERLDVPVIGFVGAPFTLCAYLLRSPRPRDLDHLKCWIHRDPAAWSELAGFWARHLADFGVAQHEAGAAAVQIFDSWAGVLSPADYERFVLPHVSGMIGALGAAGVPTIHFSIGNPALLPLIAAAGGDAVSVDWRLPIDSAWDAIGDRFAVQGNLDPAILLAGRDAALRGAREVLERVKGRPGHIFNLGHGLLPGTDHEVVREVTEFVHEFTS